MSQVHILEEMEELRRLQPTTGAGKETRGGRRMGGTTTCRRGAGDGSTGG